MPSSSSSSSTSSEELLSDFSDATSESSESTDPELVYYRYRFSGYQLPKIQLDLTGATHYHITTIHPYYVDQPDYWKKPFFYSQMGRLGNSNQDPSLKSDNIKPFDLN